MNPFNWANAWISSRFFVFHWSSRLEARTKRWSHVWNITYWNDTIGYCKWIDPFTLFAQCSRTQHKSHMFAEFIRHDITARAVWCIFFSLVRVFSLLVSVQFVGLPFRFFLSCGSRRRRVVVSIQSEFSIQFISILYSNSLDSLEPQSQVHSVGRRKTCGERKKRLVVYY